jgi:hypothetical protein
LFLWISATLTAGLVVATLIVAPPFIRRRLTNMRLDELVEQRERWMPNGRCDLDLERSIDEYYRAKESESVLARRPSRIDVSARWFEGHEPPPLIDGWGRPYFLRWQRFHFELVAELPDGVELVRDLES